jgi:hypothetical protein
LIPNKLHSTNARTKRNNVEAQSEEEVAVFPMHKLQTTQEKKRNGTSKEEESHALALGRNRGRGKKVVNF